MLTIEELDRTHSSGRCREPPSVVRQHAVRETHPDLCQQTQHCNIIFFTLLFFSKSILPNLIFHVSGGVQLTSCVHALSAVLYPMCWQHIFIPVLPPHLLDYCWWVIQIQPYSPFVSLCWHVTLVLQCSYALPHWGPHQSIWGKVPMTLKGQTGSRVQCGTADAHLACMAHNRTN